MLALPLVRLKDNLMYSKDRILTTHVGSLPRPDHICDLLLQKERGELENLEHFDEQVANAVDAVIAKQIACGIDIVSDGEYSKIGYANYVKDRLHGFAGDSERIPGADLKDFPGFAKTLGEWRKNALPLPRPCCSGPVSVKNRQPLEADIRALRTAVNKYKPVGAFLNAASPGVIAVFQPDKHYGDHNKYLQALSTVMREEYKAVIDAGFMLQIDCPDLAMGRHTIFQDVDETKFLRHANEQVDALNDALADIPAEQLRMHLCWGNYEGPHHKDIPLANIIEIVMRAKPQTLLFEAANPRHAHEWTVFRDTTIPDNKILVPGCIDSTSNFIEHPELIAQRIETFANIVGHERVIAGSDCGFSTFAGDGLVDADVAFAKLAALAEGAKIASQNLWAKS